jgi:hypothetical protein
VTEKIPAKKTPRQLAMERNKKNNKEGEDDGPSDDSSSDSDDSDDSDGAVPPGQPHGNNGDGVDPGGDEGASAPAPGGQPGTEAGGQEPDAATVRRQLDPSARVPPPPPVTHEPEPPVPKGVPFDPPGYDGDRHRLEKTLGRNKNYFSEAAFSTTPNEFEYKGVRWVRAAEIGAGSFGKSE